MFSRVAAWGFAVLLAVSPTRSGVEPDTLAPFPDPTMIITITTPQAAAEPRNMPAHGDAAALEMQTGRQDRAAIDSPPAQLAALVPAEPDVTAPPLTEPFGLTASRVAGGDVLTKWSTVQAQIRAENEILTRCRNGGQPCPAAAQRLLAVIAEGQALTGRARIGVVNRAINLAIEPMSDLAQWGVSDRWSPPLETFATGRGDCEDYAIAKYVALRAAGVADEDVKLVIVRNTAANEDHAVTAVRLDGHWVVLDNRRLTLVADMELRDAVPLFVLDRDGVRKFAAPVLTSARQTPAPASL
jgi:predicted transglutaminase-like cysteine proteinase